MPQDSHGYLSLAVWFTIACMLGNIGGRSIFSQLAMPDIRRGGVLGAVLVIVVNLVVFSAGTVLVNYVLGLTGAFADIGTGAKWAFVGAGIAIGAVPRLLAYLVNIKQSDP